MTCGHRCRMIVFLLCVILILIPAAASARAPDDAAGAGSGIRRGDAKEDFTWHEGEIIRLIFSGSGVRWQTCLPGSEWEDAASGTFRATAERNGMQVRASSGGSGWSEPVTLSISTHSMQEHPKEDAECTRDGHEAYWECTICGKTFLTAAGMLPDGGSSAADPVVIPCTGHTPGKLLEAADATCSQSGSDAHYECVICGTWLLTDGATETTRARISHGRDFTKHSSPLQETADPGTVCGSHLTAFECPDCRHIYLDSDGKQEADSHSFSEISVHPAREADCVHAATAAYYECVRCGDRFADKNDPGSLLADITSGPAEPAKHAESPLVFHPRKWPTSETAGMKGYWTCSACSGMFLDSAGTQKVSFADLCLLPYDPDARAGLRVCSGRYDPASDSISFAVLLSGHTEDTEIRVQLMDLDGLPAMGGTGLSEIFAADGPCEHTFTFPAEKLHGREVRLAAAAPFATEPIISTTGDPAPSVSVPQFPPAPYLRTNIAGVTAGGRQYASVRIRMSNLVRGERYTLVSALTDENGASCTKEASFTAWAATQFRIIQFRLGMLSRDTEVSAETSLLLAGDVLSESASGTKKISASDPGSVTCSVPVLTASALSGGSCSVSGTVNIYGLRPGSGITADVRLIDSRSGEAPETSGAQLSGARLHPDGTLSLCITGIDPAQLRGVPVGLSILLNHEDDTVKELRAIPAVPLYLPQNTPSVWAESLEPDGRNVLIRLHADGLTDGREYTVCAAFVDSQTGEVLDLPQARTTLRAEQDKETYEVLLPASFSSPLTAACRLQIKAGREIVADAEDNLGRSIAPGTPRLTVDESDLVFRRDIHTAAGRKETVELGEMEKEERGSFTVFTQPVSVSGASGSKNTEVQILLMDSLTGFPVLNNREMVLKREELPAADGEPVLMSLTVPTKNLDGTKPQIRTTLISGGRIIADTDGGERISPILMYTGTTCSAPDGAGTIRASVRTGYGGLQPGLEYTLSAELEDAETGRRLSDTPHILRPVTALTPAGQTAFSFRLDESAVRGRKIRVLLELHYGNTLLASMQGAFTAAAGERNTK